MTKRKDIRDIVKVNVRYYRLKALMSQEDLANAAGFLNYKIISDIERACWYPSLLKLDVIAEALGIETYLLLKDDGHENDITSNRIDRILNTRRKRRTK